MLEEVGQKLLDNVLLSKMLLTWVQASGKDSDIPVREYDVSFWMSVIGMASKVEVNYFGHR